MKIYSISKEDTSLIKGIAIFFIIFHNFFHKLDPSPGENEFSFDPERIFLFFQQIGEQPFDIINLLFSFLGHYGVQLFIFISGYGLAMSLGSKSWGEFVGHRIKKTYPLLLTGIIVYFLSFGLFHGNLPSANQFVQILYKLLFIHTLLPFEGTELVGPWWFFGLIFQLYLIFPFLNKYIKRYQWKALVVICIVSYSWIYISQNYFKILWSIPLMQNSPGHIMEFCFGIWFAQNKGKTLHWIWLPISIAFFVLGNLFLPFYPSLCIAATIIFTFLFSYIKSLCNKIPYTESFFSYLGNISMLLFVTHSLFRMPFVKIAETMQSAPWGIIIALIFFAVSIGVAIASRPLYKALSKLFERIKFNYKPQKYGEKFFKVFFFIFFSYVLFYYTTSALKPYTKKSIEPSFIKQEITICEQEKYSDIAILPIQQRTNALWLHYSFDYYSEKDLEAPSTILNIKRILWQDLSMKKTNNEDGSIHYETSFLYFNSFIQRLKNKDIQLYFWNNNNKSGIVKNVKVFVTVK